MENNSINQSFSNNGHSLQLRSKEVSEVMGNIPGWIGSWGALLMCLFFIISILFVFNITAVQLISGKAIIGWQEKQCFLQVVIPVAEAGKIRKGQQVTISAADKNNYLYNLSGITFLVYDVENNTESCILKLSLNTDLKEKISANREIASPGMECQLETNIPVYKRIFGSSF